MSGDETNPPPEGESDRTIFQPAPRSTPPAAAPPPPPQAPEPASQAGPTEMPFGQGAVAAMAAASSTARPIEIGDVLNHIFEVKRFIARGGMGEVFEGCNVNSDERVAIKVMLPHLAADPSVQAMFRKEARTLTRISHPALVQYRVLAQEPNLGVFYIVTEYIDGQNLSDVLKTLEFTPADLLALLKRLAQGLEAAHALGAIHRDISPDNVMLEGGKLAGAKVIDFGIAKDLDPGSATIIGEGFAGKLNYVAPEQLGDFNREVGPWTDVYSLALVMLAISQRNDMNMGGSLVDAVDKRRAGPDISIAPAELQPVLEKMLKPNPAERARSMTEVLDMLTQPSPLGSELRRQIADRRAPGQKGPKPVVERRADETKSRMPMIAGTAGGVALLAAAGLYFALSGGDEAGAPKGGGTVASAPAGDSVEAARTALTAGLPSITCTWLDVTDIAATGNGLSVALRGVAGRPAEAQGQIAKLLTDKGLQVSGMNFEDVSPIEASECEPLNAFRQIRGPSGDRMTVAQRKFEMAKLSEGAYAGTIGAQAVVNFMISPTGSEMSLFGLEPSGAIQQLTTEKSELMAATTEGSGNVRRLTVDVNHAGWSGLLLLTGSKPFDAALIAGPPGSRSGDWSQRFLSTARERGWKAEMAWFKTVDEQPN